MNPDDPFYSAQQQQQSNTTTHTSQPHIYRPIPRRNFPSNPNSSTPQSPDPFSGYDYERERSSLAPAPELHNGNSRSSEFLAQLNARLLRTSNGNLYDPESERGGESAREGMGRNKSFLNMTSSTLYGIYDEVGSSAQSVADTPWGTGAETPARGSVDYSANGNGLGMGSPDGGLAMKGLARHGTQEAPLRSPRLRAGQSRQRHGVARFMVIFAKLASLFTFGAVYGIIVSHLHDSRELAAVQVGGVNSKSWLYLAGWGLAGLALGSLLPYVDLISSASSEEVQASTEEKEPETSLGEQWNDVVRSVGAFIGIAFAIRRLPWQSTLQLTLTLALVNPALWYILDRSRNGLSFSLITTSILTSCIFLSNPDVLPSPALPATTNSTHASSRLNSSPQSELFAGIVRYDHLATATWVGSVIFCSCICFGGIGRRLAVFEEKGKR